jgi:hypothetical protein
MRVPGITQELVIILNMKAVADVPVPTPSREPKVMLEHPAAMPNETKN